MDEKLWDISYKEVGTAKGFKAVAVTINDAHDLMRKFCDGVVVGFNLSLTPHLAQPVAAHGEHGMVEHYCNLHGTYFSESTSNHCALCLGPTPPSQPKEPAACTCTVSSGWSWYHHNMGCLVWADGAKHILGNLGYVVTDPPNVAVEHPKANGKDAHDKK